MGRFVTTVASVVILIPPAVVWSQDLPAGRAADSELVALEAEAESLYSAGDLDGAARLFVALAQRGLEPADRARAWVLAAWLHHVSGRDEEALGLLAKAVVADPGYEMRREDYRPAFEDLFLEARLEADEERRRQVAERVEAARSRAAAGDSEEARRELGSALELLPGDLEALRALAGLEERSGNDSAAIDSHEKVISLIAAGSRAPAGLEADVSADLGRLLYRDDRLEEAVAMLEKAVELDPGRASSWNVLGLAMREQGRLGDAILALRQARELSPKKSSIARNLSHALMAARRSREAVSTLRQVLVSHPTNAALWLDLGAAQRGSSDLTSAAESFARALRLDPEDQGGHGALGAASLSRIYLAQGNTQSALTEGIRAVRLRPDDARCLAALGMAEHAAGHDDLSREHLERALELDPENAEIMNHLGIVYLDLGDLHRALALFEKTAILRPDSEVVLKNLQRARSLARDASPSQGASIVVQAQRKRELGVVFAEDRPEGTDTRGVLVEEVPATSPAARAGMRAGDRILRVDSTEVSSSLEILRAVESSKSRRLAIDVLRKGRQMRIEVRL